MASIEAGQLGKKVALLEPTQHVGGLSSSGLGFTDTYFTSAMGGLLSSFFAQITTAYNGSADSFYGTHFEPHVAETAFLKMLAATPNVTVYLGTSLASAQKTGAVITQITDASGQLYVGKEFIDATYTGDLMAAAGVTYATGREAAATYSESYAGVGAAIHPFATPIDPYVTPGVASSGLLQHIESSAPPAVGSADTAVMAYNYRLCLSADPANQVAIAAPSGYSAAEFEVLGRFLAALTAAKQSVPMSTVLNMQQIPNQKYDVNSSGFVSTDDVAANSSYVGATIAGRKVIEDEHQRYIRALLYFLTTDTRVPQAIGTQISALGYCRDEFTDNNNFPRVLYVRVGRRLVGSYVITQADVQSKTVVADPIGLGGYQFDQHAVHRYVSGGEVLQEGAPPSPATLTSTYPISYRALTPKRSEATNLLVSVDISSSYVGWESLRVEQTFMIVGQSAGAAASLAVDQSAAVQDVSYAALAAQLQKDGLPL